MWSVYETLAYVQHSGDSWKIMRASCVEMGALYLWSRYVLGAVQLEARLSFDEDGLDRGGENEKEDQLRQCGCEDDCSHVSI